MCYSSLESLSPELVRVTHKGQDRNKDTDVENGLEDTGRGKLGRCERVAWTYIHYQCKIDS